MNYQAMRRPLVKEPAARTDASGDCGGAADDLQSALSREIEHKLKPMLDEMIRKGVAERAR